MFIIVDERAVVRNAFATALSREGAATYAIAPVDIEAWIGSLSKADLLALDGVLIGDDGQRGEHMRYVRSLGTFPVIALLDAGSLENTLHMFGAGADDVVRKPVHARELMARCRAIQRRSAPTSSAETCGAIRVYCDGRDPEVAGEAFPLPRRERRILEHLVAHRGRRVTKTQIFSAIYGLFDDDVEETVVESHVSKLRKKLRARLGYDPIESKRFLGYCLMAETVGQREETRIHPATARAAALTAVGRSFAFATA